MARVFWLGAASAVIAGCSAPVPLLGSDLKSAREAFAATPIASDRIVWPELTSGAAQWPRYKGSGPADAAASFECVN